MKNFGRASENGTTCGTAAASKDAKATFSTIPNVIDFLLTGKSLHRGKFV